MFNVVSYLKETLIAAAFTLRLLWTHWLHGVRLYFNPNGDHYSEWEARELFETWCKKYNKTYSSKEEKFFRFGVFKETLEWCARHNKEYMKLGLSCRIGTTRSADETADEFKYHDDDSLTLVKINGNDVWVPCFGNNGFVDQTSVEKPSNFWEFVLPIMFLLVALVFKKKLS